MALKLETDVLFSNTDCMIGLGSLPFEPSSSFTHPSRLQTSHSFAVIIQLSFWPISTVWWSQGLKISGEKACVVSVLGGTLFLLYELWGGWGTYCGRWGFGHFYTLSAHFPSSLRESQILGITFSPSCCRDAGQAVRSTCCSCRWPGFHSQHSCDSSQQSVTLVMEIWVASMVRVGAGNTHT